MKKVIVCILSIVLMLSTVSLVGAEDFDFNVNNAEYLNDKVKEDLQVRSLACPECVLGRFLRTDVRYITVTNEAGIILEKWKVEYYRCMNCGHLKVVETQII